MERARQEEEKGIPLRRRMQIRLMAELESRKAVDDEELWELIDTQRSTVGQEEYIPLKEKNGSAGSAV